MSKDRTLAVDIIEMLNRKEILPPPDSCAYYTSMKRLDALVDMPKTGKKRKAIERLLVDVHSRGVYEGRLSEHNSMKSTIINLI